MLTCLSPLQNIVFVLVLEVLPQYCEVQLSLGMGGGWFQHLCRYQHICRDFICSSPWWKMVSGLFISMVMELADREGQWHYFLHIFYEEIELQEVKKLSQGYIYTKCHLPSLWL